MRSSKVLKAILLLSGVVPVVVGGAILFAPTAFFAASGIVLSESSSLLSEIRAPGGALVTSGLLVMSGAFVPRLTFTSTVISTVMYLSYAASRILSMVVDGMPTGTLVNATILELVLGLVGLFALTRYRTHPWRAPALHRSEHS